MRPPLLISVFWIAAAPVACAISSSRAPVAAVSPAALAGPTSGIAASERALAPAAALRDVGAIVESAWPSVVLLLHDRPDGKVGYGAGIVIDGRGAVLTSRHVVGGPGRLRALLYRPGRVSYTPMDGGLLRFIVENERELVAAEVEREDVAADLALVRVRADTARIPRLTIARAAARIGEPVIVVGHPQEAVWSFTSGVITGLPSQTLQHDAAVSPGSSGGPVLNARGELIGISVAKVLSEPRGFGFARPIGLASGWTSTATVSGSPPAAHRAG